MMAVRIFLDTGKLSVECFATNVRGHKGAFNLYMDC